MQRAEMVSMQPRSYTFSLACLSKQYLPFDMPVTYTVRPKDPVTDLVGFKRYAENMNSLSDEDFQRTILGVIHGSIYLQHLTFHVYLI